MNKTYALCFLLVGVGCSDPTPSTPIADSGRDSTPDLARVVDAAQDARSRLDLGSFDSSTEDLVVQPDLGDPIPGSVRFYGNGGLRGDRILIRVDDPNDANDPGPPVDVGATDFTIEFWMRAAPGDNPNPAIGCGPTNDWVASNIIIDRDRHSQPPSYGIGIANDRIVWAVQSENGSYSNCGTAVVTDDIWHHVAVGWRANDGRMWIWVDGGLDFEGEGPAGDVSYPDDGVPQNVCPDGVCDYSDPFLCFGAEKHGYSDISYNGLLDEVRISTGLRYLAPFTRPSSRFQADAQTVGLYHFDEGSGTTTRDSSGVAANQDGELIRGGNPAGPDWSSESPF